MTNFIIFTLVTVLIFNNAYADNWSPDPTCPYPSEETTTYPYYGNCSLYWVCYEGSKFLMECPEGQEFSTTEEKCDSPDVAQCDPYFSTTTGLTTNTTGTTETPKSSTTSIGTTSTSTTEGTTTSKKPGPDCPSPSEDIIYLPYDGDCTKYWECFEGDAYLYGCPSGLWWHQEVSQCDYPGDYCVDSTTLSSLSPTASTVTDSPTSSSTSTTSDPDDVTCPDPNDEVAYFPYPGDCNKYWECFEGNKYINDCPSGLWWHQELSKCDSPGDYCDDHSITEK
jgi:valyl-tRNA synthetase